MAGKRTAGRLALCLTGGIALLLLSACGTVYTQADQERVAGLYYSNRLDEASVKASEMSDEFQGETGGNALLWHIEAGSANMDAGKYGESLKHLRRAEKLLYLHDSQGKLDLQSPGRASYSGFRSDRILLSMFKFFDYLSKDQFEDALVEIRRMRQSQYRFLLNDADKAMLEYNRKNSGRDVPPYRMKTEVFDDKTNNSAFGLVKVLPDYQEYNSLRRPVYSAMFHPLAFYLSAVAYYWDNDWDEAAIDLKYLYEMQLGNELIRRDYATVLKLLDEPYPDSLKNAAPWSYSLCDDIVFVIVADGRAPAWTTRSVSFQIPGMVPAKWRFPILEKASPMPASTVTVSAGGRQEPLYALADLHQIFNDEYWQLTMPEMIRRAVNAIRKQTQAHTAAKASLAAAIAAPDYEGKAIAVAAAAAAVAATRDISMNDSDWRRWATVPRRFMVTHFPIPKDRKVTLALDRTQTVVLKPETHRAVIYIRKLDDAYVPHVWESSD